LRARIRQLASEPLQFLTCATGLMHLQTQLQYASTTVLITENRICGFMREFFTLAYPVINQHSLNRGNRAYVFTHLHLEMSGTGTLVDPLITTLVKQILGRSQFPSNINDWRRLLVRLDNELSYHVPPAEDRILIPQSMDTYAALRNKDLGAGKVNLMESQRADLFIAATENLNPSVDSSGLSNLCTFSGDLLNTFAEPTETIDWQSDNESVEDDTVDDAGEAHQVAGRTPKSSMKSTNSFQRDDPITGLTRERSKRFGKKFDSKQFGSRLEKIDRASRQVGLSDPMRDEIKRKFSVLNKNLDEPTANRDKIAIDIIKELYQLVRNINRESRRTMAKQYIQNVMSLYNSAFDGCFAQAAAFLEEDDDDSGSDFH